MAICHKGWLVGPLIMWGTSLVYHFTDEKIEAWRYEKTWPWLINWPVKEIELNIASPRTPCSFLVPNKQYLHMTNELDGDASAFVLKSIRWMFVYKAQLIFPSILICAETFLASLEACFGGDQPVFASPPDHKCCSAVPLVSNWLAIFLGYLAHYLTVIYTYLHFPSSKPTYNM